MSLKYKIRHTHCRSGNMNTTTMTFSKYVFDNIDAAKVRLETIKQNMEKHGYTELHYMWNQEKTSVVFIHTVATATGYDYAIQEYSIVGHNR